MKADILVARARLRRRPVAVTGRTPVAVAPEVTRGGFCSAVQRATIRAETEAHKY